MKFNITNRFSGAVQFTAEIDCADDAGTSVKIGLAVMWAIKSGADLSGAYLSGAYLSGADLSRADLSGADLSRADLSRADLSWAYLSGADLSRADLSGADLSGAYLSGADLSGAYLSGADLSGADLSRADLSRADLSWANLIRANLIRANLIRAYLIRAYLSGADLSRANGLSPERSTPLLMLLDQPGKIRAYKLVDADYCSPIQSSGKLKYEIGKIIAVKNANTDPTEHCAAGINVATLDWCLKEWRPGYRVLIVEFEAKDIACIPTATDGKFRLHRCEVIAEKTLDLTALGLVKDEAKAAA
jgi:hypothetical protein